MQLTPLSDLNSTKGKDSLLERNCFLADPYPSFFRYSSTFRQIIYSKQKPDAYRTGLLFFPFKGVWFIYPTVHRVTRLHCYAYTVIPLSHYFILSFSSSSYARFTEPNHITWETLSDNKLSPLFVQKYKSTTAGLGYLEVSLDCPCKYPPLVETSIAYIQYPEVNRQKISYSTTIDVQ